MESTFLLYIIYCRLTSSKSISYFVFSRESFRKTMHLLLSNALFLCPVLVKPLFYFYFVISLSNGYNQETSKINKQGYGLAGKGHKNAVNTNSNLFKI